MGIFIPGGDTGQPIVFTATEPGNPKRGRIYVFNAAIAAPAATYETRAGAAINSIAAGSWFTFDGTRYVLELQTQVV